MAETRSTDVIEHVSSLGFDATVQRLIAAIAKAGMTLFVTIDHAENARRVGLKMPPATVLIYGNGKGGTPIMLLAPHTALDLPLHALVQQRADGRVVVVFRPIADMLRQAGVPPEAAARLEPAQSLLVVSIS